MKFGIEQLERLVSAHAEMPEEEKDKIRRHFADVATRHGLQHTAPIKFVVEHSYLLNIRSGKGAAYFDNRRGISMFGNPGTGKTIATAFLAYCYEAYNIRCQMVSALEISRQFSTGGDSAFWEVARQYDDAALIIDDIGAERDAKHYGNSNPMAEWIMHRYARWQMGGHETHLTGNLDAKQFKERYGTRVYDRVKEFTVSAQFTGASLRG